MESNYLLWINEFPVQQELRDYFEKFDLKFVQQNTLVSAPTDCGIPYAVLISWFILKNNLQAMSYIYNSYNVPILITNENADEEACVLALGSGADDFLTLPLNPRALHARITAIKRRLGNTSLNNSEKNELMFANWRLIPASRQLFNMNNQEVQLSAGEYDLLFIFIQRPQRVLDRGLLLQITKNSPFNSLDRRIDVQISRLRQKIEADPKKPRLIKTIRNNGYMFTPTVVKINFEKN
ncbi:MAG: response regulator transcription factor [Legionella sp.]|nr:response regulator transcription factor [Legionella sp.]